VPVKVALPNAPSLTLPLMLSPSTVASNSSVIGIGDVMAAFQLSEWGDEVYLAAASGGALSGYVVGARFGASEPSRKPSRE